MENKEPIDIVLQEMTKEQSAFRKAELKEQLIFYVNHLLLNDFSRLVQLLYTVDVDEHKLKGYLSENKNEDAAVLIAEMIISRQEIKVRNRSANNMEDAGEEGW